MGVGFRKHGSVIAEEAAEVRDHDPIVGRARFFGRPNQNLVAVFVDLHDVGRHPASKGHGAHADDRQRQEAKESECRPSPMASVRRHRAVAIFMNLHRALKRRHRCHASSPFLIAALGLMESVKLELTGRAAAAAEIPALACSALAFGRP